MTSRAGQQTMVCCPTHENRLMQVLRVGEKRVGMVRSARQSTHPQRATCTHALLHERSLTMARLPVVDPTHESVQDIFGGPLKGKEFNIFKGMANSPAVLKLYLAMAGAVDGFSLSPAEREVIQLATAEANGCDYCTAAHTAIGKGAGLSEQQTVEARQGRIDGDDKLNALAQFASALHSKKGFVSDEDLAEFKSAGYTDGHVAEVVGVYAQAVFTNYFNHVNETEVDFPAPPVLA